MAVKRVKIHYRRYVRSLSDPALAGLLCVASALHDSVDGVELTSSVGLRAGPGL